MITQFEIIIPPQKRGFNLITDKILDQLHKLPEKGILNLFLQHTSAGLCINENADPSVRIDLENIFNKIIPENQAYYTHTQEGADDMPAHAKSIITSGSLNIPIINSRLALGIWQGIYLCEFRNQANSRKIIASIYS